MIEGIYILISFSDQCEINSENYWLQLIYCVLCRDGYLLLYSQFMSAIFTKLSTAVIREPTTLRAGMLCKSLIMMTVLGVPQVYTDVLFELSHLIEKVLYILWSEILCSTYFYCERHRKFKLGHAFTGILIVSLQHQLYNG